MFAALSKREKTPAVTIFFTSISTKDLKVTGLDVLLHMFNVSFKIPSRIDVPWFLK